MIEKIYQLFSNKYYGFSRIYRGIITFVGKFVFVMVTDKVLVCTCIVIINYDHGHGKDRRFSFFDGSRCYSIFNSLKKNLNFFSVRNFWKYTSWLVMIHRLWINTSLSRDINRTFCNHENKFKIFLHNLFLFFDIFKLHIFFTLSFFVFMSSAHASF